MDKLSLKELAIPIIKAIDSFNYLLKSHHRRTAVAAYHIGKNLGVTGDDMVNLIIAAAMHDIGALSVQERNMLLKEDVVNPSPHCLMGHKMLNTFKVFENIARIIKHHHIKYEKSLGLPKGEVLFQSHIVHLADRVDILISPDEFILMQKKTVTDKIKAKSGSIFHPKVVEAFEKASKADIFWIDINNMEIDQLFKQIDFTSNFELTVDNVIEFAQTISRIIDFRSRFTVSHSYTVAHLAEMIGHKFDLPEEMCKKLMIAGFLHDVGKVGIDPRIIEKKGKLDEMEFSQIKLHSYYTGQILNELSNSDWFVDIVQWAQNHHEKSDGTGYPMALTEGDIDIGARILAFSDVITALMEERPYREKLKPDVAFAIIEKEIAPALSPEMFEVIKMHTGKINQMVSDCQQHTFSEFNLT